MTTVAPPTDSPAAKSEFDPDSYRMTFGEHLEELRMRIIFALLGFAVATIVCLVFGQRVTAIFCRPLINVLQEKNLNPQLFYTELSDGFMVFMKISLICAAAVSAPWIAYQLWQFVGAGLYPHERKYVTKYVPLSLGLMIAGMLFVYFLVLPLTIRFFITFGNAIPLPQLTSDHMATNLPAGGLPTAPILNGDPPNPTPGQFWINKAQGRLKIYFDKDDLRVIPFGPANLLAPHITLPDYIDLVVGTLLTFGLCFQLPLVVLALAKIGIVELDTLKKGRRYVYFAMTCLAAAMTPGDVVTAMLALMAPLILLYEFGIFLATWSTKKSS